MFFIPCQNLYYVGYKQKSLLEEQRDYSKAFSDVERLSMQEKEHLKKESII